MAMNRGLLLQSSPSQMFMMTLAMHASVGDPEMIMSNYLNLKDTHREKEP